MKQGSRCLLIREKCEWQDLMSSATRVPCHTTAVVTRLAVVFAFPEPPAGSQCRAQPWASVPINRVHTNEPACCRVCQIILSPLALTLLTIMRVAVLSVWHFNCLVQHTCSWLLEYSVMFLCACSNYLFKRTVHLEMTILSVVPNAYAFFSHKRNEKKLYSTLAMQTLVLGTDQNGHLCK